MNNQNSAHSSAPDEPGAGLNYHARVGRYLAESILHAALFPTESSLDLLRKAMEKTMREGGCWKVFQAAADKLAEYEITVI